jgi:hypothetical protein
MNEKKVGIIVITAVVLFSASALALIGGGSSGVPSPNRAELISQCMNDPFDHVEKQSVAYCECFAENYPKLAKQLERYKDKTIEEIAQIQAKDSVGENVDVMAKCEPLRARDLKKEAQVFKQQLFDACIKSGNQSAAYCECEAEFMAKRQQESVKANSADANKPSVFADAFEMQKQCDHLRQDGKTISERGSSSDVVEIPDHLDVKDEHGNTVRLPVKLPPQLQKQ